MAASTSAYGTYNPGGIDPFPIESTLAQIVGTNNPAQAGNLLDTYRLSNTISADNYNAAMQDQHEYAKQALAQQLYEANLKGLAEAKDPNVLQLMAGNPTYSGVLGNNTANISDVLQRARSAADAVNFEKLGQGTSAFRAGGAMPDLSGLNQKYGLNLAAVDPTSVEAAKINAAGRVAAAGVAGRTEGTTAQLPPDPRFPNMIVTSHPMKGESYD